MPRLVELLNTKTRGSPGQSSVKVLLELYQNSTTLCFRVVIVRKLRPIAKI